ALERLRVDEMGRKAAPERLAPRQPEQLLGRGIEEPDATACVEDDDGDDEPVERREGRRPAGRRRYGRIVDSSRRSDAMLLSVRAMSSSSRATRSRYF